MVLEYAMGSLLFPISKFFRLRNIGNLFLRRAAGALRNPVPQSDRFSQKKVRSLRRKQTVFFPE